MGRIPNIEKCYSIDEDEVLIIVSDGHLGAKSSFRDHFRDFLEDIFTGSLPCTRLILCGDTFDLWRRSAIKVFEENYDIIELLKKINTSKVHLHLIVGNHDYSLRKLGEEYPLKFVKGLRLIRGDEVKFAFVHGDEFDPIQREFLLDVLCCCTNDAFGKVSSKMWEKAQRAIKKMDLELRPELPEDERKILTDKLNCKAIFKIPNIEEKIADLELAKKIAQLADKLFLLASSETEVELLKKGEELANTLLNPNEKEQLRRLLKPEEDYFPDMIEPVQHYAGLVRKIFKNRNMEYEIPNEITEATEFAKNDDDILIFGHTHKPFINKIEGVTLANSGGWQRFGTEWVNSFLVIEGNRREITLNSFTTKKGPHINIYDKKKFPF